MLNFIQNKLKITNIGTKESFEDKPLIAVKTMGSGEKRIVAIGAKASTLESHDTIVANPFSHPRTLLKDFYVGEKVLQHTFSTLYKNRFPRFKAKSIVHPMEKLEVGLTMIEARAFRELAVGAGSFSAKIYVGDPLSITQLDFDNVKSLDD
ncbi:hypothetical protein [Pseudoalteromonas luteoviolacea]|uniref:Rod shape-determining protein MreB n=1 Tax=Pseudoalteromonas luteoviolacea S4060-1 TaxID=1365257 RepID=A0A167NYX8_9GAMM|nr:hypothetical protein [Pseudoalteromonas luteoviolacea]KZN69176.1 hypothetical protein N478_11125 [Pseudoalteromonas luteoviolacea S4060-1]